MMTEAYNLGANYVLNIINGKWKPSIICFLGAGENRYGELFRHLNETSAGRITKKVLTEQLNQLINDHVVKRTDFKTLPLHVEYSLTPDGEALRKLIIRMSQFGDQMAARVSTTTNPIKIRYSYRDDHGLPIKNED